MNLLVNILLKLKDINVTETLLKRMQDNGFGLGEGYEALACVSGSFCQTRVIRSAVN
jgi:pentatricopeptide repeat protein